ncbi:MAG: 30S ribosomal protein S20 [Planctomycetes bacterium]|nr:30S ribosomal protein S20 [Planctomycetota bacterium]MCK5578018.1 30S ribosomal protein S20 [Planctomycetota bacterium]
MAHSVSARKRVRQSLTKQVRNQTLKSRVKTQVKKMRGQLSIPKTRPTGSSGRKSGSKKTDSAGSTGRPVDFQAELKQSYVVLDRAVASGVMHKNKAARLKSRLTRAVNKSVGAQ